MSNPSELFLAERSQRTTAIGGGIQSRRIAANSSRTTSIGVLNELCDAETNGECVEQNRVSLLLAVMEKRLVCICPTRRVCETSSVGCISTSRPSILASCGGHIEFARGAD